MKRNTSLLSLMRNRPVVRTLTAFALVGLGSQLVAPLRAYALTSGPAQPEFASFESVGTSEMVNPYTGDFTYNLPLLEIPGPDGAGYPISLSYHSGNSPESDASWVGYGWTLNPGAVTRNKSGFPDDSDGDEVTYYNQVPKNWTVSLSGRAGTEIFGNDKLSLGASRGLRYNNYKGLGYQTGVSSSVKGLGSLGYNVSDGEGSFSLQVNPLGLLNHLKEALVKEKEKPEEEKSDVAQEEEKKKKPRKFHVAAGGSNYGLTLASIQPRPLQMTPYTGSSVNLDLTLLGGISIPAGVSQGYSGNYNWQKNRPVDKLTTYGYMYLGNATAKHAVMDYAAEREGTYIKRDHYLPIPMSGADGYMVNGEGLGGGFRLHRDHVGHYRPNKVNSFLGIASAGVSIDFPAPPTPPLIGPLGVGIDFGLGIQVDSVSGWHAGGLAHTQEGDEAVFFRMNADPGGVVEFGSSQAKAAGFHVVSPIPGAMSKTPTTTGLGVNAIMNGGGRSGRAGYVGYHTNEEMLAPFASPSGAGTPGGVTKYARAYTQRPELLNAPGGPVNRTNLPKQIGEITFVNEGGMTYHFGLPVFSRNESNLQYGLKGVDAGSFEDNHLAFAPREPETASVVVGEVRSAPYATQYLLTEILSPDYIDRKQDGPTQDDFGAWTKFTYDHRYGTQDKKDASSANWYKWRMPYRGLGYSRGELSTRMDDMGAVSHGEKEIYYLETIETRTHIAIFTTSDRLDAIDAEHNEATASGSNTAQGGNSLRKLDKIELYAKTVGGTTTKLLKTVHFEYEYSAWPGTPNSDQSEGRRLTLRKVWFDYEDKVNARVSPYIFYYGYPTSTAGGGGSLPGLQRAEVTYPTEYASLCNYGAGLTENPGYDPQNMDAWGCHEPTGSARKDRFIRWKDQTPPADYDPAAWELKSITLPTGGQIHIQYENDSYRWVQDQPAMALVSLKPLSNDDATTSSVGVPGNTYYIDLAEVGLAGKEADVEAMIRVLYQGTGEKIYFKFLYALIGNDANLDNCVSEFIDGYCRVEDVGVDASGLWIRLGGGATTYNVPRRVCRDYVEANRLGKLDPTKSCDAMEDALTDDGGVGSAVSQLLSFMTSSLTVSGINCLEINPADSYFRIPMPEGKLGGGTRVKRILMYEPGVETDKTDRALYGTEYLYVMDDGLTSGVASNEPQDHRGENPLVRPLIRSKQGILDKVISGKDKKQMEGPIGENLLPNPSVGYRRVIAKSIHDGTTSPGFTVHEFNTPYEFPFNKVYAALDGEDAFDATEIDQATPDWLPILTGVVDYSVNNIWLSQGYRFVDYAIYGQPRRVASYGGDPTGLLVMEDAFMSSCQEVEYFAPGESLPMMNKVHEIDPVGWYPGKEMEVLTETREVSSTTIDGRVETDFTISAFPPGAPIPPLVFATAVPYIGYTERQMRTHVTTKVVHYPAIAKRTRMYENGIWHTTENVAFDPLSGKPLLTRTTDGYDGQDLQLSASHNGQYHSFSIPGTQEYSALRQKASNERAKVNHQPGVLGIRKQETGGNIYLDFTTFSSTPSDFLCEVLGAFEPGDLVLVTYYAGGTDGLYHVREVNGSRLTLVRSGLYASASTPAAVNVNLEIIKSGRSNELATPVGGFTTYGNYAFTEHPLVPGDLPAHEALVAALNAQLLAGTGNVAATGCTFTATGTPDVDVRLVVTISSIILQLRDHASTATPVVVCEEFIPRVPGVTGSFSLDPWTGQIVYKTSENVCKPFRPACLTFCDTDAGHREVTHVITAQASTLSDVWPWEAWQYGTDPYVNMNVYERGERGQWRVQASHQYREAIVQGDRDDTESRRTYKEAGTFPLRLFNFESPSANDPEKWLKATQVTAYSPFGMATEERDILGIYSAAKMGYLQTLPYMMAKNASQIEIYYEGFEMVYGTLAPYKVEEGVTVNPASLVTSSKHSGARSYTLTNSSPLDLRPFELTEHLRHKGLMCRIWIKEATGMTPQLKLSAGLLSQTTNFNWIARTGEWTLYEAKVTTWGSFTLGSMLTPTLQLNCSSTCTTQVDDIRYQPLDAEATCNVYDPVSFRLLTSFDDQHFGKYNVYDGEGRLTRVMVETERGMKMLQESQYHTPLQVRPH